MSKKTILRNKQWVYQYLQSHCCAYCGYQNPIALEFHHINPETKSDNISELVKNGASWLRIMNEIKKCKVLCANCHRIETSHQFNQFRYQQTIKETQRSEQSFELVKFLGESWFEQYEKSQLGQERGVILINE